jgi:hypothetical protein
MEVEETVAAGRNRYAQTEARLKPKNLQAKKRQEAAAKATQSFGSKVTSALMKANTH